MNNGFLLGVAQNSINFIKKATLFSLCCFSSFCLKKKGPGLMRRIDFLERYLRKYFYADASAFELPQRNFCFSFNKLT